MGDNLTIEQKQALDELVRLVAQQQDVAQQQAAAQPQAAAEQPPAVPQAPAAQPLSTAQRTPPRRRPAQAGPPSASSAVTGKSGGALLGLLDGLQPGTMQGKMPELLETWLGIKPEETAGFINSLLSQKDALQNRFLDWADNRPMDAAFEFLTAASLAFYLAEKEANPKIKTYIDAFYYISTSASVGYADIFAVTQTGRTIAALVMILGPALTSHALSRPDEDARRLDPVPASSVLQDRKEKPNGHVA